MSPDSGVSSLLVLGMCSLLAVGAVRPLDAQQVEVGGTGELISVPLGHSRVVTSPSSLSRVLVADPEIAEPVVVSARQVVINGKQIGTSTLLFWNQAGTLTRYTIRVTADAETLQRLLTNEFPESGIQVSASGNTVVLRGQAESRDVAAQAVTLAESLGEGVSVMDEISFPQQEQVLLHVRFAEVSRSAMQEVGARFLHLSPSGEGDAAISPGGLQGTFPPGPTESLSNAVNFFLFHRGVRLASFIEALRTHGTFRSLAEPNLLALPGDSASFLAGGEFPYPVLQSAGQANAVTIQFREFGIRLGFFPSITNSGAIRLRVAPEVSQLDFTNGLTISGFNIPALTTRRAETTIELREGQTFAIAGLVDQSMVENESKIPVLGDIPILGQLFRSESIQQNRSELLVLVTPELVGPVDEQPPLPTGDPTDWDWDEHLQGIPFDDPVDASVNTGVPGDAMDSEVSEGSHGDSEGTGTGRTGP